jgi:hypothetical protein
MEGTPWSRALLEKLIVAQIAEKSPVFIEPEYSVPCSQELANTSAHHTSLKSILILSSHLRLGLPVGVFLSDCTIKTQARKYSYFLLLLLLFKELN